jgi:hypothetical protein
VPAALVARGSKRYSKAVGLGGVDLEVLAGELLAALAAQARKGTANVAP